MRASSIMAAPKLGDCANDRGIAVGPIIPVASEYTRLPSLKQHLATVAVVFDLVNPVLALRRLIDRGSKLGRDKAKARNAGHGSYLASLSEIASQIDLSTP
jgi:hypothetical protein